MNLVLFTPAIRSSAIGRMAALVVRQLSANGHQVAVIRTEAETYLTTETHEFNSTVLAWNKYKELDSIFGSADSFIYQIGDNFQFHQGCTHWLPILPGLVCLHDFFLGHLFWAWADSRRREAISILQTWYGEEIANQFFQYPNSESFIQGTKDSSPLTEWICSMANAVITHSEWGCERVLNSCPGPVHLVPLAYNLSGPLKSYEFRNPSETKQYTILTIGHINPNKRIESVIKAIGLSSFLKQHATYRLIGPILQENANILTAIANDLGVRLIISGEVDDGTLLSALEESDVVCCLRWPTLEASSASAIEAMLCGKPIIVTNSGFYSEIPDKYVLKVSPENEIAGIQCHLETLYHDKNLRKRIGMAARAWASQTFTAENYANNVIRAVEDSMKAKPALDAIKYFHGMLYRWSEGDMPANLEDIIRPLNVFED